MAEISREKVNLIESGSYCCGEVRALLLFQF